MISQKVEANKVGRIRITSILKQNLTTLANVLNDFFCVESKIYGPSINEYETKYYELVIQKKTEISKIRRLLYFVH